MNKIRPSTSDVVALAGLAIMAWGLYLVDPKLMLLVIGGILFVLGIISSIIRGS